MGAAADAAQQNLETAPDRHAAGRRIWLVADDYGISPAVNLAIRDLVARGRLNATSVMVAAPSLTRAEALALRLLNATAPRVAIGLHVTLTAPFRPRTAGFAPTRAGAFVPLAEMMKLAYLGRLDGAAIAAEIDAQLAAFHALFERLPDFVDGHHHVHLLPAVREALLATVKNTAPHAWVRQCGSAAGALRKLGDPKGLLLDLMSRRFRARAAALGVRTNPAFAGTYDFATRQSFGTLFARFLDGLPDGGVVMCHPGEVDDELRRVDPVTDRRADEYAYLGGGDFAALLRAQHVSLA